MPVTDRRKAKGRREGGSYAAMPHAIFRSTPDHPAPAARLSRAARCLLLDIAMQFNGKNNGSLTASPAAMELYGWSSRGTLNAALVELVALGFLELTRQGGRNSCSRYALTWLGIDPGSHDATPAPVATRLYQEDQRHRRDQSFMRRWEAIQGGSENKSASRYSDKPSRYADKSGEKRAA